MEADKDAEIAHLKAELAKARQRNDELEDGLAERDEQLLTSRSTITACEDVKNLQSKWGDDFMHEFDKLLNEQRAACRARRNWERKESSTIAAKTAELEQVKDNLRRTKRAEKTQREKTKILRILRPSGKMGPSDLIPLYVEEEDPNPRTQISTATVGRN